MITVYASSASAGRSVTGGSATARHHHTDFSVSLHTPLLIQPPHFTMVVVPKYLAFVFSALPFDPSFIPLYRHSCLTDG